MGLFFVTSILGCLIFLPMSFTIFQFFMAAENAFLLSFGLCFVTIVACLLCRFKIKPFIHESISILLSIVFAYLVSGQVDILMLIIVVICIFIFIKVKSEMNPAKGMGLQIAAAALLFNMLLSFLTAKGITKISTQFSNIAILISTISSVVLLIIKQTDDSRRFGSKNMKIGNTQRRNNKIFTVASLIILFGISAIGQVQKIYSFVIKILAWLIQKFGYLFGRIDNTATNNYEIQPKLPLEMEQAEPSLLQRIIQLVTDVLIVAIVVAFVGFTIYFIVKAFIKLIQKILNWFRNGEQAVKRYYEDGHVDEKQSLYNKNLNNIAKNIRQKAASLFVREVPYNKLPNDIAKTRRLFKYFKDKAKQDGVQMSKSSTSDEICQDVSEKAPETKPFNDLISKCYAAARYGEVEPLPDELTKLENRLLK